MSKGVMPATVRKNHEVLFKIKKLLVGAIFDPEYAEFFLNTLYDNMLKSSQNSMNGFEFNDADKSVTFSFNIDNVTDYYADQFIRNALGSTFIAVASSGRMCDILYLKDAEGYNLFNTRFIYGTDQANSTFTNPELLNPKELSYIFNINSFGNGRFILSLIQ